MTRRLVSGVMGLLLLLGTLVETCRGSFGLYEEHYLFPKEKYGVLTQLRWQDFVFLASFCLAMIVLFYLSYRLLKYSFKREPSVTA
jgi:hypothetical protein